MKPTTLLPIEPILPALRDALRRRTGAVLVAPPGAGKSTRVPLALLDEPWLARRRILMLEPRRLAARAVARFMAAALGEPVGGTVGYRVRLESRVGAQTRLEVITEGVLTRMLQADPALTDVGLVIFDEFHERSLHADLGLALCLESQAVLRDDLRLLVMSATLAAEPVATLLGDAPVVVSEGRSYPVQTHYLERRSEGRIEPLMARSVIEALAHHPGDILAFLPGAGEIRRVAALLGEAERPVALQVALPVTLTGNAAVSPPSNATGSLLSNVAVSPPSNVTVAPLYGNLPQEAQDQALLPSPPGRRKVVLASSIAETSLTVEGVQVVIDSGLMRVPRFSPRTGMTRLETLTVSRASADQRRGRAGRLGPGVCYRLWTEAEEQRLLPQSRPEILEADLAPLALELAAWGVKDPADLRWLDPPPPAALAQARDLLAGLGALDGAGTITPHGRRMAESGLHPRLSHMILSGIGLGLGNLACDLAALLSDRDILRGETTDVDIRLRLEALRTAANPVARRVRAEAAALRQEFAVAADRGGQGRDHGSPGSDPAGPLLALAYPDRIGQARGGGRFLLRSGRGAVMAVPQPLMDAPCLVAADLDDQGSESRIFLAAPVELADLRRLIGGQIQSETLVSWDLTAQAVRARVRERLGALVLKDGPLAEPDPEAVLEALLQGIRAGGLAMLPWTKAARQLQERLCFMHHQQPDWPDATNEALTATLEKWLAPHLFGLKSRDDLQQLRLAEIIEGMLTWEQRQALERLAPTHVVVPSGSHIPIDYSDPASPVLAVRLQEMFGLPETPAIFGGRVPLTLHLLSPAHRPIQVTRDLASFWREGYFEARKELRGRYPKHYWPDDPLKAPPTNRTRPRP